MEVIAVTANSGYDANTGERGDEKTEKELPGTVTLLVTPEQGKVLAELELSLIHILWKRLHILWLPAL